MRLLVDTHVLLSAIAEPERIPASIRDRLESSDNEVFFSAASIWEVAIKQQIGRLNLPVTPEDLAEAAVRMGFEELPVTTAHATAPPVPILCPPTACPQRLGMDSSAAASPKLYILQGPPGVGPALACRLLLEFGSVERVITADEASSVRVRSVGSKTATRMREVVC